MLIDGQQPPKNSPQPDPPAPPPPPPPPAPPPPPPPDQPPTENVGSGVAATSTDADGRPIYYTDGRWYYADGTPAAGPGQPPPPGSGGVAAPPAPTPAPAPTDQESYDIGVDLDAGAEPTADELAYWEQEAEAVESGLQLLEALSHPAPGTLIGFPYVGTHSIAFNRAGGSDNWQSENAVDVWLYPGTHVLAPLDGVVSPGQWGYGLSSSGGRFAGWRCHLVASNGRVFFFTHMAGLNVLQGQQVKAGAYLGDSGVANGVPHLHFAARPPFDPRAFYQDAFTLKGRTSIGTSPKTGGPPAEQPSAPSLETAWLDLMRVLGLGLPAAASHIRDARRALGPAVS